jgi:hypothetical protein
MMWGASGPLTGTLLSSSCVSALFLAFFVLEHCVNAQCPYKDNKAPAPSIPLPKMNTDVLVTLVETVYQHAPWELPAAFLCISKSQLACIAIVTLVWCSASIALLLSLSVLAPNPRPEEVSAFRTSSVFSFLQQILMLIYLAGVEGGFQVSCYTCAFLVSCKNGCRLSIVVEC